MSILKTQIKQNLDLNKVNLVKSKLPDEAVKKFKESSKQIEHLTFLQKIELVNKGYSIYIDNYYIKLKNFINDKDLEKKLEDDLYNEYLNNLPETAKVSCLDCDSIPQIERSCEYFNMQFHYFQFFSAAIIYDEIRRYDKSKEISKEFKEKIAVEFLKSIKISSEGFGLDLGRIVEMLIDNELYQTAKILNEESLEDRYKICLENFKELKHIEKYAKWKIKDNLIFNKWTDFWKEEDVNIKEEIEYSSKLNNCDPNKKINTEAILDDLLEITQRILNRGGDIKIHEDFINDKFTDHLETKGYAISDQKRYDNGRIDIAIKSNEQNTITSIEATKFHSSKTIEEHLHKLLHRYNSSGNKVVFLLIYSFDRKFGDKWKAYKNIINKIKYEEWEHPLKNDLIDMSNKKDIPFNLKLGFTEHNWYKSDDKVSVYHIFINTYKN